METTLTLPKKNDFYNPERSMYVIPLEKGDLSIEVYSIFLLLSIAWSCWIGSIKYAFLHSFLFADKHLSDEDIRLIFQVFENDSMRTNLKRINLSRNDFCFLLS